jgi:hypothetical protein
MALGWIYVLSNKNMPGMVKIGQTASDPSSRAAELYTTGVPSPFRLEYKGLFDGYAQIERAVHASLSSYRENGSREFFCVTPNRAIEEIRSAAPAGAKYEELAASASNDSPSAPLDICHPNEIDEWTPTTPRPHIRVRRLEGAKRLIEEATRIRNSLK